MAQPTGPRNGASHDLAFPARWRPLVFVAVVLAAIIVLIMLFAWLRQVWTDLLWFDSLGYQKVFRTILLTKIWLFFVSAGSFALLATANVLLVYRYSRGPQLEAVPPGTLRLLRWAVLGGVVFIILIASLMFGVATASRWEIVLSFANSTSFGAVDPQFGKDASFYVFHLPLFHFLNGWVVGALIVLMLLSGGLYAALTSLRGAAITLANPLRIHLSFLGVGILVAFFFSYWLSIYDLSFSNRGAVFGASYADVNARVFADRVLMAVVLGGVVLLLYNAFLVKGLRLIGGVIGLWIGAVLLVGLIYPALVQRFQVQPNELDKERPYIERNIAATRQAFGLAGIQESIFPLHEDGLTEELVAGNPEIFSNLRLWDHRPLKDVLNQVQFIRLYYDFHDVDVDRYSIKGEYRQVMLGVRELSPDKLPVDAQRWVNRRLQFTHGQGIAMAPVTEFTTEGRPVFFIKDVPPVGVIPIEQPAVYFGETNSQYVVVNSKLPEFDYPTETEIPVYTSYEGKGGVRLGGFWRRLAYAWQFRDINILISGQLTEDSRIMYRRTVQEGISAVAPFLRLDQDPYIVVADGGLFWIQDAYTVTGRYPYSQRTAAGFNYIRNSVKVVVDAYDGTQTYYVAQPDDPLVQTYQKIFPGLFQPLSDMPASLSTHLRYPEDLFSVQAEKYLTYHMRDPTVFFNKEDQWSVPNELYFDAPRVMDPYYLIMKLPGESAEEFVMLLPFTPNNRPNLVAWMAARMDGEHYGKLVAYTFPKDRQVDGPEQVEARIDNDPAIRRELALYRQGGARVLRGNLLVIPVDDKLLYVEPLFLQPASLPFPVLTRVIMVDGVRVTMQESVDAAITALLERGAPPGGARPPAASDKQPEGAVPVESGGSLPFSTPPSLQDSLREANQALEAFRQQLQKLEESLQQIERQLGESR
ncbi:MAG: UPF0182 family protein [Dehalococcoidia bacterium]|nr:UPF0182 family protein [Dehalococcoidia bacterium]